ncbi:TSUP family transporter [Micrococcales bacterium 31B]|nr:TSUP family transporter [Micrococcales bacterium 31B]
MGAVPAGAALVATPLAPAAESVWFPPDLALGSLALVIVAGFAAGFVDAVVGGGGLIQLPALLLVPGLGPVQAMATNKLGSICGTITSSITYYRRSHPDLRRAVPMAAVALLGSVGGALVASHLPASVLVPIVLVALVVVLAYTIARPRAGADHAVKLEGAALLAAACALGAVIGFYDGMAGPGTGSFLVFGLVALLGYAFVQASATAKIVNAATNLGALLIFVPQGYVMWGLGLALGAANLVGGYLGARLAITKGSGFVRVAFIVVASALLVKLGWQEWQALVA